MTDLPPVFSVSSKRSVEAVGKNGFDDYDDVFYITQDEKGVVPAGISYVFYI